MYEFYQSLPYIVLTSFSVFIITGLIMAYTYSEDQFELIEDGDEIYETYTKFQNIVSTIGALAASVFFVFGTILLVGKLVEYLV